MVARHGSQRGSSPSRSRRSRSTPSSSRRTRSTVPRRRCCAASTDSTGSRFAGGSWGCSPPPCSCSPRFAPPPRAGRLVAGVRPGSGGERRAGTVRSRPAARALLGRPCAAVRGRPRLWCTSTSPAPTWWPSRRIEQQGLVLWTEFFNVSVDDLVHVYGTRGRDGIAATPAEVGDNGMLLADGHELDPRYAIVDSARSSSARPCSGSTSTRAAGARDRH